MLNPVTPGIQNLLALATELERVDAIYTRNGFLEGYYQAAWEHECGTPACALGHYAAMRGARSATDWLLENGYMQGWAPLLEHFSLGDEREWSALFGTQGCGQARTAGQAAAYIRAFIARKIEAMANV